MSSSLFETKSGWPGANWKPWQPQTWSASLCLLRTGLKACATKPSSVVVLTDFSSVHMAPFKSYLFILRREFWYIFLFFCLLPAFEVWVMFGLICHSPAFFLLIYVILAILDEGMEECAFSVDSKWKVVIYLKIIVTVIDILWYVYLTRLVWKKTFLIEAYKCL